MFNGSSISELLLMKTLREDQKDKLEEQPKHGAWRGTAKWFLLSWRHQLMPPWSLRDFALWLADRRRPPNPPTLLVLFPWTASSYCLFIHSLWAMSYFTFFFHYNLLIELREGEVTLSSVPKAEDPGGSASDTERAGEDRSSRSWCSALETCQSAAEVLLYQWAQ